TTTWNDPLAASYRLSEVIDFSSTGWLRSVVVSANGLRSCGSRCTADATRAATATATTAASTQPRRLVARPARITRVIFGPPQEWPEHLPGPGRSRAACMYPARGQ